MRETHAGIVQCMAGCRQCDGDEPRWDGKNAMAVAARHHDATGHTTWVQQVLSVRYGPESETQLELFYDL